jgi:hypothetical protein
LLEHRAHQGMCPFEQNIEAARPRSRHRAGHATPVLRSLGSLARSRVICWWRTLTDSRIDQPRDEVRKPYLSESPIRDVSELEL